MVMDLTELLAFTAQVKGASGVRAFLQDHRQQVPDVLVGLSESVLLGAVEPGIRMEQFSLRVQREIWSTLASAASPREEDAVNLARAFLRVIARPGRRESDGVCVSLAKMVLRAAATTQEDRQVLQVETPADAAFRRRMRRMNLHRVVFPSPHDEDDVRVSAAAGPAQAEAITRILRSPDTVPADQLDGFIQKSLAAAVNPVGNGNDSRHLLSNESALLVFQNILNTKPVLLPLTVERFVGACEAVLELPEGEQLQGSLKFATVLFTLISKYPQHCIGHVETLEAIATRLTSIMAKTTLRSLQKLKTSK
ncbi:hypothetical protein BBO99_00000758 [Phytophthora kernoviae]|uniref:Fanconi Anaemia group E protein C-terminal domain-containing protein n=2 Tax=Phytophthora kernoviae TaxID=325452 RepID=A0A3R7KDA4_9STRA|nr:hypothetical protein G195_005320 [Phytophthora kernoviae 00238/432]KAG2527672.1 hypothetical protein JM16_001554 [Phytophthora kernoviae]KAG2528986.1 hypothetical protein JM18_001868 [Phytophthora kernoviae]RLN46828.1 hypothetical protein BBI17_000678 [Phytophthora kernoviae]RLN85154.1 hypothetical protein BBO99_00000758 [Phytophthora kernoviae]